MLDLPIDSTILRGSTSAFFTSWYGNFRRLCQFCVGVGKQSIGQQSFCTATLLFSQRGVNHISSFNLFFEANLQFGQSFETLEKLRDINGRSSSKADKVVVKVENIEGALFKFRCISILKMRKINTNLLIKFKFSF